MRHVSITARVSLAAVVACLIGAPLSSDGLAGDFTQSVTPPPLLLPFPAGQSWQANGPHSDNGTTGTRAFVDLGPKKGSGDGTVVAAMSGTVHNRICKDVSGVQHKYVEVTSGDWTTRYRHLKSFAASDGSKIAAGTAIGSTGGDLNSVNACGWGTFSHVHFGLLYKGVPYPLDGVTIGGYTIHAGSGQYNGWWTRNQDGKTVLTITKQNALCCILNDQSLQQVAMNKIITVTGSGTSYFYDGHLHWIPDVETYWCLRNVQGRAVITASQTAVNGLGDGNPWVSPCFDPSRVIGHVVRESGGTSFFVTTGGPLAAGGTLWHWIPDAATYNCLVGSGATVIQSNWTQINSLRGANGQNEGPQAICSPGNGTPTITSIPDITIAPNDSGSYPVRVNYADDDCDIVGGTWVDPSGVSHDFGASHGGNASYPGGCSGGIGYLTPGYTGCTSPDGKRGVPGSAAQTITITDKLGHVSTPFVFYVVCQ